MRNILCLLVVVMFLSVSVAWAVPSGKTLEFSNSPQGSVNFDGKLHKDAGNKCKDCHNKEMFPKMKQGTVAITMDEIYAGKLCGVCHNGERAFSAQGNCNRCHIPK